MKKILILGAEGMLGHMVQIYFKEKGYDVKATARSNDGDRRFDAMENIKHLEDIINELKPDVVINCIGVLNQVAEDNRALAVMLNSYLPHYADELCRAKEIKFIHVSTDCVFDGKKGEYNENSFKDTSTFYGQSKALGEISDGPNLTLRTSIIGPDRNEGGIGLFQWFMNQSGRIDGFDKVIWTGVTTLQLAKCMEKAIENNLSGLRHAVNNDKIDKYSLLNLIKEHFKKDIDIRPKSDKVSDKSLIRLSDFDFEIPSYDAMIREMREWIENHPDLYSENQRPTK